MMQRMPQRLLRPGARAFAAAAAAAPPPKFFDYA
eukprot:SAG22_NODE_6670_length_825_cov_0.809917_1_plen_33_part_10